MNFPKAELETIKFKHRMSELCMLGHMYYESYLRVHNSGRTTDYYHLGEDAGNIFRLKEYFYDKLHESLRK